MTLKDAEKRLSNELLKYKTLAIAVSGGADSTFLATFATKYFDKNKLMLYHAKLPFSPKNAIMAQLDVEDCENNLERLKAMQSTMFGK